MEFNKFKACISLIPITKDGMVSFRLESAVYEKVGIQVFVDRKSGKRLFNPILTFKGHFGEENHFSEYQGKDKFLVSCDLYNNFVLGGRQYPSYVGYFDNIITANREYSNKLIPHLMEVLEHERVNDQDLVEKIKNFEFSGDSQIEEDDNLDENENFDDISQED